MYCKSRNVFDCFIAGFAYYDGLEVIDYLKPGLQVTLENEADNPYGPEAVAIFVENKKVGYIPKSKNSTIREPLYFGYGEIIEVRVSRVNPETVAEQQICVVVKLKDNRNS